MNASISKTILLGIGASAFGGFLASRVEIGHDSEKSVHRRGQVVTELPVGFEEHTVNGNSYYEYDGIYYREYSGGYVSVNTPRAVEPTNGDWNLEKPAKANQG